MGGEFCSEFVLLSCGDWMLERSSVEFGVVLEETYVKEGSIAVREASRVANGESVISLRPWRLVMCVIGRTSVGREQRYLNRNHHSHSTCSVSLLITRKIMGITIFKHLMEFVELYGMVLCPMHRAAVRQD